MSFVQGICPNCGGTLAVDNTKDAAICQYCNTPFIVEKAINQFNISNVGNINISNANINNNITTSQADNLANACKALLDKGDIYGANPIVEKLLTDYPSDYRGHWYDVMVETKLLKKAPIAYSGAWLHGIGNEVNRTIELAKSEDVDDDIIQDMQCRYENFYNNYLSKMRTLEAEMRAEKEETERKNKVNVRIAIMVAIGVFILDVILFKIV